MKTIFYSALVLICLAGGFYLATDSSKPPIENSHEKGGQGSDNNLSPRTVSLRKPGISQRLVVSTSKSQEQPPEMKTVTHSVADFQRGQMDNVISIGDSLSLGTDTTPLTHPTGYSLLGLFTSPEEQPEHAFNTISVGYQATMPQNSAELRVEFRTRSVEGVWSTWQRVGAENIDQPFTLDSPASIWQYRLTFRANARSDSPLIQSVTVATWLNPPVTGAVAERVDGKPGGTAQ